MRALKPEVLLRFRQVPPRVRCVIVVVQNAFSERIGLEETPVF
jgi:hypothetical protein